MYYLVSFIPDKSSLRPMNEMPPICSVVLPANILRVVPQSVYLPRK